MSHPVNLRLKWYSTRKVHSGIICVLTTSVLFPTCETMLKEATFNDAKVDDKSDSIPIDDVDEKAGTWMQTSA
jgi:hypothetical protein